MRANDNDNHRPHVILTTDLAGRVLPVLAPLPELPVCTVPLPEMTAADRAAFEEFRRRLRWAA